MKYQTVFETTLVPLPDSHLEGYYHTLASLIKKTMHKEKKQNELLAGSGNCGADRDAGGDVGALAALKSTAIVNETEEDCNLTE